VCDLGRPPFTGRAQSAWEDLEDLLIPAAEAGELPIRVVSYMPLATWCVRREPDSVSASRRPRHCNTSFASLAACRQIVQAATFRRSELTDMR